MLGDCISGAMLGSKASLAPRSAAVAAAAAVGASLFCPASKPKQRFITLDESKQETAAYFVNVHSLEVPKH